MYTHAFTIQNTLPCQAMNSSPSMGYTQIHSNALKSNTLKCIQIHSNALKYTNKKYTKIHSNALKCTHIYTQIKYTQIH